MAAPNRRKWIIQDMLRTNIAGTVIDLLIESLQIRKAGVSRHASRFKIKMVDIAALSGAANPRLPQGPVR